MNKPLNKSLSIDKSNWTKVKLGDVVAEPRDTVKDFASEQIEHVVGLEHIDSEDIHLRRSASMDSSTTFTKKFSAGDVLFGRRRAYLKKAAQAKLSGICSGDITVMRVKEDLLPELLPFVVNNDKFFDYAVKHSAGGLSPRVKFKDLADYEFLLPPKDQQTQLAELLWAMDVMVERDLISLDKLSLTLDSDIECKIHGVNLKGHTIQQAIDKLSKHKEVGTLSQFGKIFKGKGIAKSEVVDIGLPCVRYGELYTKHHRLIRKFHSFITNESATNSIKLKKNDVLFAGSGETIAEIGKSATLITDEEVYAGGDILIFRPYDMDGVYLGYLLNSQLVRQQLNKYGTGATVMHIYASDIEKIKIPVIKKEEQINIGQHLEFIANSILMLKNKISSSKSLQKSLINQIF